MQPNTPAAPTTDALTLAETVAWAERWFVAENVVLTCLGAVPAELDVRLPDAHTEAAVPALVRESLVTPVAPVVPGGSTNPRRVASRKQGLAQ